MRIVVAGGSGFLGRTLIERLSSSDDEVVVLTRGASSRESPARHRHVRQVAWSPDGTATGEWVRAIDGADAVVNLAGAGIADKRWTAERKALLLSSRVDSTRSLVAAVRSVQVPPSVFVQGSAVGYYGATSSDAIFDESSPAGDDFLASMAAAWEKEAAPVAELGVRLVVLRTGLVLAREGGVLPQMSLPFRLFGGGPVSSGRQFMSWIDRDDWSSLAHWMLTTAEARGPFNASAPGPVTNETFSAALARAMRRPNWMRVPAFALRLAVGEMADSLLLKGQRVVPRRALDLGYRFRFPEVEGALRDLLRR